MTLQIEAVVQNGRVEIPAPRPELEGQRVVITFSPSLRRPATEDERQSIIDDLIDQMRHEIVTGGRGYLLREELYEQRLGRYRG
jgi:hypothetical protein